MNVKYYVTNSDQSPFHDYVGGLKKKEQLKILSLLSRIEKHGAKYLVEYNAFSKKIEDGIFEIKINNHRIIYTYQDNSILILHIFKKSSQKTPLKELEISRERLYKVQSLINI